MRIDDDKKGVELSMNLVIVGVIALIILIIVILLVTGVIGNVKGGLSECTKQSGGHFATSCQTGCNPGEMRYLPGDKDGQCCCVTSLTG